MGRIVNDFLPVRWSNIYSVNQEYQATNNIVLVSPPPYFLDVWCHQPKETPCFAIYVHPNHPPSVI